MKKEETKFRENQIDPFLKNLPQSKQFTIQQQAIVGTPDKFICIAGNFVALEIKDVDGELSPMQIYNLDCVEDAGGISLVVDQNNWQTVQDILYDLAHYGVGTINKPKWRDSYEHASEKGPTEVRKSSREF